MDKNTSSVLSLIPFDRNVGKCFDRFWAVVKQQLIRSCFRTLPGCSLVIFLVLLLWLLKPVKENQQDIRHRANASRVPRPESTQAGIKTFPQIVLNYRSTENVKKDWEVYYCENLFLYLNNAWQEYFCTWLRRTKREVGGRKFSKQR